LRYLFKLVLVCELFFPFTCNADGRAKRTSYLGASDAAVEGTWSWQDGTPWGYSNWGAGEPNGGTGENCLLLELEQDSQQPRGWWNDVACEGREGRDEGYVCSYVNGK